MTDGLFKYIAASKTAFHAAHEAAKMLDEAGFLRIGLNTDIPLKNGRGYYVMRGMSSIIAFRAGDGPFMITAAHSDSPSFKLKETAEIRSGSAVTLNSEKYGGMIMSTWFDRPLGIAGRAVFSTENGVEQKLFDIENAAIIPSLAIHLNRDANNGCKYNAQKDMNALFSLTGKTVNEAICTSCGKNTSEFISADVYLYNAELPKTFGAEGEFFAAPRIDDLESAYIALKAFIDASPARCTAVFCLFDSEEVGSSTNEGADSDFLARTLSLLNGVEKRLDSSMMLSIDNAHAFHPNYPEKYDPQNRVYLGGGVVIKHSANRKYSTDALSSAIFTKICEKAGARVQHFSNRSDVPGGSTLGNISSTHVSVLTADIGLCQLAMHSACETASTADADDMYRAVKQFYSTSLCIDGEKADIF